MEPLRRCCPIRYEQQRPCRALAAPASARQPHRTTKRFSHSMKTTRTILLAGAIAASAWNLNAQEERPREDARRPGADQPREQRNAESATTRRDQPPRDLRNDDRGERRPQPGESPREGARRSGTNQPREQRNGESAGAPREWSPAERPQAQRLPEEFRGERRAPVESEDRRTEPRGENRGPQRNENFGPQGGRPQSNARRDEWRPRMERGNRGPEPRSEQNSRPQNPRGEGPGPRVNENFRPPGAPQFDGPQRQQRGPRAPGFGSQGGPGFGAQREQGFRPPGGPNFAPPSQRPPGGPEMQDGPRGGAPGPRANRNFGPQDGRNFHPPSQGPRVGRRCRTVRVARAPARKRIGISGPRGRVRTADLN